MILPPQPSLQFLDRVSTTKVQKAPIATTLVGCKVLALFFPYSLWYNNSVSFDNSTRTSVGVCPLAIRNMTPLCWAAGIMV